MDPFLVFLVEQKQWLTQAAAASVPRSLSGTALDNHLVAHGLLQRGHVRRGRLEFDVQLTVDAHAAGDGDGTVVAMDPNSLRRPERDNEPDEVVEEDAALEPEAAQQIGGLTLTRVLSRQRKVVCYRAHDGNTKEDLVVRTYRFQDANAPAVTAFLQAPIPSAYGARSRLSPYRGRGMGEGLVWISRQYVEGQSLADWIGTEGQLPVATVETVGKQLLLCIANLHERGLAHGALHAKNVILRHAGREPVLTDYALGDMVRELASTRRRASGAVAPELRTAADATSRTDMWSFALLVCEMLAGSIVSTGSGGQAAAHTPAAVIESGLARLEAGSFRKLVEKCASDDPFARPLNGRAGLTLVNLSYVEDPTPEAPEELAEPEPEGGRWRLAVASVAAVALAGVGIGWWSDWWQAPVPIEPRVVEAAAKPAAVHRKSPPANAPDSWYEDKLEAKVSVVPPACDDANCSECNAARAAWLPIENRRLLRQDLDKATSALEVAVLVRDLRLDGDALLWGDRKLLAGSLAKVPANEGTRAWWEARLADAVAEAGGTANTAEPGSQGGRDVAAQQLEVLRGFVEVPSDWTREFLDEVVAAGAAKTLDPEAVQARWARVEKAQVWKQSPLEGLRRQLQTRAKQADGWLQARKSVTSKLGALPKGGLDAVEKCADALLGLDSIPAESRFPFAERETTLRSLTDACLGALRDHGTFDPDLPHEATAMVSEKFRTWSADRAESVLSMVSRLSPSPALMAAGKALEDKKKFKNEWCTVRGRWESLTELEKQVGAKFAVEVHDLFQFCVAGQPGAADWRSSLAEADAWWKGPSVDGGFDATVKASQAVLAKVRLRIEVLGALDLVSPWGALTKDEFLGIKSEKAPQRDDDGYLLHVDDRERRIGSNVINPSPMRVVTKGARKVYVDLDPYDPKLLKVTQVDAGKDPAGVLFSCEDAMAKIDGWMRAGDQVKPSKVSGFPLRLPTWDELRELIQVARLSPLLTFKKAPEFCDQGTAVAVMDETAPELVGLAGPWAYTEKQTSGFDIFSAAGLRLVEREVGLSNVTFRCARNAKPKPPSTPRQ